MAEMMYEKVGTVNRENKIQENFTYKDNNVTSELSDDSDIEILTPCDIEENTIFDSKNNFKSIQDVDKESDFENVETKDNYEPNSNVEIINLSSDDEDTQTSKDNILERKKTIDYTSDNSESHYEEIEIEIESDDDNINIKQNSEINLDELFLDSDEECIMFDFSNYTADDVLKAVENNKLLTEESVSCNVNENITEHFIETEIEIKESKLSLIEIETGLNTDVKNNNERNETAEKINSSSIIVKPTFQTNEAIDYKKTDEFFEPHLILQCKKCGIDAIKKINIDVDITAKRKCPTCSINMSFQCEICTCLFHSIFSFCEHLKSYHKRENENILRSIDNLQLKRHLGQKVKKVKKVQKVKKKKVYKCLHCPQSFIAAQNLRIHRINCHIVPYLYCRFCPLNIDTIQDLRTHLIKVHSSKINQSDLPQILNGIEQEGYKIMDMDSILLITCINCKYSHQLHHRERQCSQCRSSLMFKCGERKCLLLFMTLGELTCHVRQHHLHTWHRCHVCGARFTDCSEMRRHRLLHHPQVRVSYRHCEECHYEATSPGDMSSHVHSAHKAVPSADVEPYRGPFICRDCGNVFKLEHRLKKHQRSFCRKTCATYNCAHCRYTSFDKDKLLLHLKCCHVQVYTGQKLSCRKCGIEVSSIFKLNSHLGKCKVAPQWRNGKWRTR